MNFVNCVVSGEIYTAGKNFTLPPAVTAWTNLTSGKVLSRVSEYQTAISILEHVDSCFIKQELIWKKTFCTFNGDLGHK